jgi:hypothetical protein
MINCIDTGSIENFMPALIQLGNDLEIDMIGDFNQQCGAKNWGTTGEGEIGIKVA